MSVHFRTSASAWLPPHTTQEGLLAPRGVEGIELVRRQRPRPSRCHVVDQNHRSASEDRPGRLTWTTFEMPSWDLAPQQRVSVIKGRLTKLVKGHKEAHFKG